MGTEVVRQLNKNKDKASNLICTYIATVDFRSTGQPEYFRKLIINNVFIDLQDRPCDGQSMM